MFALNKICPIHSGPWMLNNASERAYDRAMNCFFIGILFALVSLEGVQRFYVHRYHVYWPISGGHFQATAGLVGVFAVHWLRAASWTERKALVASATMLGALFAGMPGLSFKNSAALIGLALADASIAINVLWIIRERGISPLRLRNMRDAWFILLAGLLAGPMIAFSTYYGPLNDGHIFAFEETLGIRIEALVHAVFAQVPLGREGMEWIYGAAEAIFVFPLFTAAPRANPLLPALVAVGAIGYVFYALCPAIGIQLPAYYQSIWPAADLDPADFISSDRFVMLTRNTVPSIHAACAYLMLFNAWRFTPTQRRWVVACGLITLISAIENGQHWFTDLVIALPYTVATLALTNPDLVGQWKTRIKLASAGYAATLFWMVLIRQNWIDAIDGRGVGWALTALTIVASIRLLRQHDAALGREPITVAPAIAPSVAS
jgi:hypothetical protein